ncbi:Gypsy retrotransposon integrase-like protein 1 [Elysia marginata]|uniref:Gypsy retrotransposon integrase-like protein 1 n=1 Tax=Elysia marginata TaxID=1093978 RepID=A0AAV4G7Y0_9GAST|nr:Gypsy retrotransposon integrase-like protein 1 [Elysia marginata]
MFRKTLASIKSQFSWPNLYSDVKKYVRPCHVCQIKPRTGHDKPAPLQHVHVVEEPFQRVIIDIVGPLPVSEDRFEYLLTMVDVVTRWAEAVPLRRITATDVAESLFQIFCRLGFPLEIQSDRGQQFMSHLLAEFNKLCDINHYFSTPYHPQTNGVVERFHGTLKSILGKLANECPTKWTKYLPAALFAYRNQVHVSTGFSPFFLLFGRAPRGPMEILKDLFTNKTLSSDSVFQYHYVLDLHNRIRMGWQLAGESLRESSLQSQIRQVPKSTLKTFLPGDDVLVLLPTTDNKLILSYRGPYKIIEKRTNVVYLVDLDDIDKPTDLTDNENPIHFPQTIDFASPVAYLSAVSEEDGTEIGSSLPTPSYQAEVSDVKIDPNLKPSQVQEVKGLLYEFRDIITTVPGCTNSLCHEIRLKSHEVIRVKPYPLPFAAQNL